jgi:pimeloyl-ACP methyl ester carboxylesterase
MPRSAPYMRSLALLALVLVPGAAELRAQTRTLTQDSSRNNLVQPPGLATTPPGELEPVLRVGSGGRPLVFLAGAGFGGDVYRPFADSLAAALDATVHLVTLPGFGEVPPWPVPAAGTPWQAGTWMGYAGQAVARYLDAHGIARAAVVAHWIVASQVALRLAIEQPERVSAVALLSGVAESHYPPPGGMQQMTLAQRHSYAEAMGSRWFRTVTPQTWHDNNFMPYDYAVNPLTGTLLWRRAAEPALSTWIRYLLEFYAMDITHDLPRLRVPLTVVQPGLDDPAYFVDPSRGDYMRSNLIDSWRGTEALAPAVKFVTIAGARLFVTHDRPTETLRALRNALARP